MQTFLYKYILFPSLKLISYLPLGILYFISDVLAVILNFIVGYRRGIILDNLKSAFPEKSNREILKIKNRYYRVLTDYIVESIKMLTIKESVLTKHYRFVNPEYLIDLAYQKRSIAACVSHYGNWEWGALALPLLGSHEIVALYKPLSNKFLDELVFKTRARFGTKPVTPLSFVRTLEQKGILQKMVVYISDQSPLRKEAKNWLYFLGRKTAIYPGMEKMARRHDQAAVYCRVERPKRGFYTIEFIPIHLNPKEAKEHYITKKYFELLEKDIRSTPEYWVWSHKRWKYDPDTLALDEIKLSTI